jgi:hypothetical protein
LRTSYGSDYEALLADLEAEAGDLSLERLVSRLLSTTIDFVETHPAFLPLLDAPLSTRSPESLRYTIRLRLAGCFAAIRPGLHRPKLLRLATVTLQLVKGLNQLYAEAAAEERGHLVREYRVAITCYLAARLGRTSA